MVVAKVREATPYTALRPQLCDLSYGTTHVMLCGQPRLTHQEWACGHVVKVLVGDDVGSGSNVAVRMRGKPCPLPHHKNQENAQHVR